MTPVNPIEYGNYFLTRKIATGGMAELFRARKVGEAGFEKLLVIKRLLPHLAEDQELRTMFLDEARLASQLTHANIAQVYDLGKAQIKDPGHVGTQNTYFIAMEYVFGKSLAETIRRGQAEHKTLSTENALKIVLSTAQGLEYAHGKKDSQGRPLDLVHRDISPQNLLVSYEGEVKLVDFGIAKALTQSTATRPGMLKGKFSYMAPEQARGEAVDQRTDIYALGVVLWESLTGRRLFTGDSEAAILGKVLKPQVEPPSSAAPGLAAELDEICLKCLDPEPDQRYTSAKNLCVAIEEHLRGSTTYPSTYSLRNYMQELFGEEIGAETGQIQREMELVLTEAAQVPEDGQTDSHAEATQLFQVQEKPAGTGGGFGKKILVLAGAALAILVLALGLLFFRSDEPAPKTETAAAPKAAAEKTSPAAQAAEPAPDAQTAKPAPAEKGPEPGEPGELAQARADIKAGRFKQGLAALDELAARNAQWEQRVARDRARALVGMAAVEAGQKPQKALADLDRAVEYAPDWAEVHYQTGRILTRLLKFDQALTAYSRAAALDPKLSGAYFNQGYIYLQEDKLEQAISAYQQVVGLDSPYKADAYVNLAVCYARLDQKDQAVKMLRLALAANPNHKLAERYLKKLTTNGTE